MEPYRGDDPVGFVVSLNLRRRHLNEGQRQWCAAKIANLGHGQKQSGKFAAHVTQEAAASMLNVSERGVRNAAVVRDHGTPELQDKVALTVNVNSDNSRPQFRDKRLGNVTSGQYPGPVNPLLKTMGMKKPHDELDKALILHWFQWEVASPRARVVEENCPRRTFGTCISRYFNITGDSVGRQVQISLMPRQLDRSTNPRPAVQCLSWFRRCHRQVGYTASERWPR